ncbi:MAG TPA: DNRLRE domain-containing protein, partial [Acidimicrobiia bacterium]|nr:DNRLRE domain-containing protein [Acidimicrobiia bacterium]
MVTALGLGPVVVGDPAGAVETRLISDADARVEEAKPGGNFGSSSRLVADLSPQTESYVRFTVPALEGTITKATLRLRVEDSTGDGPKVRAASSDWAESTLTWSTRPAPGAVLADAGKLSRNTWATYDVTAGVTGPGPVSFHLGADSKDGVTFTSRQSSRNRPELIVVGGGSVTT